MDRRRSLLRQWEFIASNPSSSAITSCTWDRWPGSRARDRRRARRLRPRRHTRHAHRHHSSRIQFRVPEAVANQARDRARAEGTSLSELAREAGTSAVARLVGEPSAVRWSCSRCGVRSGWRSASAPTRRGLAGSGRPRPRSALPGWRQLRQFDRAHQWDQHRRGRLADLPRSARRRQARELPQCRPQNCESYCCEEFFAINRAGCVSTGAIGTVLRSRAGSTRRRSDLRRGRRGRRHTVSMTDAVIRAVSTSRP